MAITALGELLIDFTPMGLSPRGNQLFEQNPGGAPANLLATVAKFGAEAALISAVGQDLFGDYLIECAAKAGIQTRGIQTTSQAATTLAFVHLDSSGDRSFHFSRKPGADQCIAYDTIDPGLVEDCDIFHFGSLSLGMGSSKAATLGCVLQAAALGVTISYDPNWRPALWPSEEEGIAAMHHGLGMANLVKLSEEELLLLSGSSDPATGTENLLQNKIRLVVVTLGEKGCYYRSRGHSGYVEGYPVQVVDTTGAGDVFWGTVLWALQENPALLESQPQTMEALRLANAAGALCCTGYGAIPSIPDLLSVRQLCGTKI